MKADHQFNIEHTIEVDGYPVEIEFSVSMSTYIYKTEGHGFHTHYDVEAEIEDWVITGGAREVDYRDVATHIRYYHDDIVNELLDKYEG